MSKRKTQEEFLSECMEVHGSRYDYKKVHYVNALKPVIIICSIHGEFYQTPSKHINGRGCQKCGGSSLSTTNEFISKANTIHKGRYDYHKVNYQKWNIKVTISCKIHGDFLQSPNKHLCGDGCPKCLGHGFSPDKHATFYVHELSLNDNIVGYKYGITNSTAAIRKNSISRNSIYSHKIIYEIISDGKFIFNLERYVKSNLKNCLKFDKQNIKEGYTETLYDYDLNILEDSIIEYITNNMEPRNG